MSTAVATPERNGAIQETSLSIPPHTQTRLYAGNPGAVALWSAVADPVHTALEVGQVVYDSGICGAKNKAQGTIIFLTCMAEQMALTDFAKVYHIIDGKLSKRADAMLADFNMAGGRHRWINKGEDGLTATIELTYGGKTDTATYTIEMARQQGLIKKDGNWVKIPWNMLRARCITDGLGMHFPQFKAGVYSPEELGYDSMEHAIAAQEQSSGRGRGKASTATTPAIASTATVVVTQQSNVIEAEVVEPQQTTTEAVADEPTTTATARAAPAADVVPTQVEVGESQLDPAATSAADTDPCTEVQLNQIRSLLTDIQKADPQIPAKIQGKLAGMGKKKLSELTISEAQQLIQALFVKAAELAV